MSRRASPVAAAATLALAAVACGGDYPAFAPSVPHLSTAGGAVMTRPRLVAVTFPGDPLAPDVERFLATVGGSGYWKATTAEYGVASAIAGPPVHLAEAAPTAIRDSEIVSWLGTQLDGTHPEWPAPDGDTLYVLFYPASTTVTLDLGEASTELCQIAFGYHKDAALPDGRTAIYAVVPRCAATPPAARGYPAAGLDLVTGTASHELVEAVTDPHPLTTPAWNGLDADHGLLAVVGSESGDLCAALESPAPFYRSDEGFTVQRTWSNASATAGHDPCVPAPDLPYFGAVPQLPDEAAYPFGGRMLTNRAVTVPVGQTRTIDVKLFSDRDTDGPFEVLAMAVDNSTSVVLDKTSGRNGDTLHLTIDAREQALNGVTAFEVVTRLGGRSNVGLGLIRN